MTITLKLENNLAEQLRHIEQLQLSVAGLKSVKQACKFAKMFRSSITPVCDEAIRSGERVQINQCKILLSDGYFEWYKTVPKAHRERINDHGHVCIFHVFHQAYQALKLAELKLTGGPVIYIPPPPPPTIIKNIYLTTDAIPIGETVKLDELDDEEIET